MSIIPERDQVQGHGIHTHPNRYLNGARQKYTSQETVMKGSEMIQTEPSIIHDVTIYGRENMLVIIHQIAANGNQMALRIISLLVIAVRMPSPMSYRGAAPSTSISTFCEIDKLEPLR